MRGERMDPEVDWQKILTDPSKFIGKPFSGTWQDLLYRGFVEDVSVADDLFVLSMHRVEKRLQNGSRPWEFLGKLEVRINMRRSKAWKIQGTSQFYITLSLAYHVCIG